MASEKIQSGNAEIAFLNSASSGINCYGRVVKDPTSKTVRVFLVARSSSNISDGTNLTIIPEGFRPRNTEALYGVMATSSATAAFYGSVYADGRVQQKLGDTTREVALFGEYAI